MATLFYKDTAAIHKYTEIILPGNRAVTIPIGELTTIPDELASFIPEGIPHLTVIMGDGSPKGQTAEAVIKNLPDFSALSEQEENKEVEDGVEKAKDSARGRGKKAPSPLALVPDFSGEPIPPEQGL